jgi:hypothetical protein
MTEPRQRAPGAGRPPHKALSVACPKCAKPAGIPCRAQGRRYHHARLRLVDVEPPKGGQAQSMQKLRAALRRKIRGLSPAEARALAQSWAELPDSSAAKITWVVNVCGGWTQSLMGLLAVELPRRMTKPATSSRFPPN